MTAVVGLTGGIASGKSTVARFFADLGVPVVDADQLARDVVAPGSDGLREVVAAFGDSVLAKDGTLDRKALGAHVFADPDARARLNAITHPRIAAASAMQIAARSGPDVPYVLYEAALLVELGLHHGLAALVVVAVSADEQVARVVERDGLPEAEARARVAAQLPLAKKLEVADHVIWTDGTKESTRERTLEVHRALLARFAQKATEGS